MCVKAPLRYLLFNIGLPTRFCQKWSTSKYNISKKPIVPKFLAQILKEQEWTNISNRISWSGFSGAKQGGGLKLANFEK